MRRRPAAATEKVRRRSARRRYLRRRLAKPAPGRGPGRTSGARWKARQRQKPRRGAHGHGLQRSAQARRRGLLDHAAPRARLAAGARAQLPGFSHRRRGRAPLRERILQRSLRIHREPGDPPPGGRIGKAWGPCLDARRHNRLPGYRRRITRHELRRHDIHRHDKLGGGNHPDVAMTPEWMDAMGVDYSCLFPTPMLFLGLHPQVEVEVAMCRAYNRWLCERILAVEPRIVSMLYLPFNDPDAAYKTVKDFGDKKGV